MKTTEPNSAKSTEKSLNAKDIATIIKVAKSSGITHFRYGNLEFSFKTKEKSQEIEQFPQENTQFFQSSTEKDAGSGPIPLKIAEEDRLHDLMIADPLAYEEEIEKQLASGDE